LYVITTAAGVLYRVLARIKELLECTVDQLQIDAEWLLGKHKDVPSKQDVSP
jgi:hypothetical protein